MPREKEAYRDNLALLIEKFPNKNMLRQIEVAQFCGMCARTAAAKFPFKDGYISIATLARCLS